MAAVCAKVEAANKLQDPLEAFPVFKKYDRNGLNVSIECRRVSGLEPVSGSPSTQMKKVMLTVFKHNLGAFQFFREALQFEVDPTSPSVSGCCGDDSSYEILSRSTRFGDPHPGGGPCGGCCH
ncbi:PREDICTED: N-alpha-acetyltransferase 40 [Lepidothrix coronata]|uniref:N-alpha-acetyltransferase 40 n=1 Tax=Lepidothrix coronata TaxID=321398 RepID=A0A6J0J9L6_9PASS|nr:PREDICTED: N-alpha-acetyltransferase 40 [Lepidothrix coronata]